MKIPKLKVFVGMKHGYLTVQREVEKNGKSIRQYECLCDCGAVSVLRSNHFYESRRYCTRKCPLLSNQRMLDLTGKTINRWTVIELAGIVEGHSTWKASCQCGTQRIISGPSLLAGQTKSCGCLLKEKQATGRTAIEEVEIRRLRSRLSNRKNPARIKANKIKYETKRLSATPKWLTPQELAFMNDVYEVARRLTQETGVKYQVDHILPLNGKLVSGLHVLSNLQILTQAQNVSKSNIYAELHGDM